MKTQFQLLVRCFLVLMAMSSLQVVLSQCDCIACLNTQTVSRTATLYTGSCLSGQTAAVKDLNIASTDASSFKIYTKNTPSSSEYYTGGSSSTSVSCFNKGSALIGGSSSVAVVVECTNLIFSCPLKFDISAVCLNPSPSPSPSPPSPSPSPSQTNPWTGRYRVNAGCSMSTCCCLTDVANVIQVGSAVSITSSVSGQCGGQTKAVLSFTLSDPNSVVATANINGQSFTFSRNGNQVFVTNNDQPACSGSATLLVSSASSPQNFSLLMLFLVGVLGLGMQQGLF